MNPAVWLERAARRYPDEPALMIGTKVLADYAEFYDRTARLARAFKEQLNVLPGDLVAIVLNNCPRYLELLYAIWHVGAVAVPINAKLHPKELAWMLVDADAKLLVCEEKTIRQVQPFLDAKRTAFLDANSTQFSAFYDAQPLADPLRRHRDDVAWLFYTSGTTGKPKGAMITNGNIEAMVQTYFVDVDAVTCNDATLYAAPMSHGAGLYNFMFVIKGARHVFPVSKGFDEDEIFYLARALENLCLFAAPTMVHRLVTAAKKHGYDGAGLKTLVYGGGPMYVADIEEAVEVLGQRFVQIYGQGESPMTITVLPRELVSDRSHPRWRERLGSVGFAQSCADIMIADSNGRELQRGQVGEILVSGAQVMKAYWRNEDATRDTIRDGWLRTGDLGIMDADGFVTLNDRSKDVIISGGTNIYPREVEEVLLRHASVAQVAVIGMPDREWGESVLAFIVLHRGAHRDEKSLDAHCMANIARFKRPKRYIFQDDLPKNAYGKVLKRDLLGETMKAGEVG